MNQFIAVITCLHVVVHGVFGCGVHHAPASGEVTHCCMAAERRCHIDANELHVHDDDHAASHESHSSNDPADPLSPDHSCGHENCQWLTTGSKQTIDRELSAPDATLVSLAVVAPLDPLSARDHGWASQRFHAPALRTHLALRVLLI